MGRFKNGSDDILVATDIAARGIDVPAVGNISIMIFLKTHWFISIELAEQHEQVEVAKQSH